VSTDPSKL